MLTLTRLPRPELAAPEVPLRVRRAAVDPVEVGRNARDRDRGLHHPRVPVDEDHVDAAVGARRPQLRVVVAARVRVPRPRRPRHGPLAGVGEVGVPQDAAVRPRLDVAGTRRRVGARAVLGPRRDHRHAAGAVGDCHVAVEVDRRPGGVPVRIGAGDVAALLDERLRVDLGDGALVAVSDPDIREVRRAAVALHRHRHRRRSRANRRGGRPMSNLVPAVAAGVRAVLARAGLRIGVGGIGVSVSVSVADAVRADAADGDPTIFGPALPIVVAARSQRQRCNPQHCP